MGNVCGAEAPVNESDVQLSDEEAGDAGARPPPLDDSLQVTELIDALVSTALPLVRKMISKKLIHQGLIVRTRSPSRIQPARHAVEPFTGLGSTAREAPCPLAPALTTAAASPYFSGWPLLFGPATPPPAPTPPSTPHPNPPPDETGRIGLGSMHILTPALMKAEMEKYPDFAWPKDCVKEMMEDKELLVLEMNGLSVGVFF